MKTIGLDVHKSFCQVAILDPDTGVFEDFRIQSTPGSLKECFLEMDKDCRIALEASSHWHWVVDELQEMGLQVMLSHPTKTKAIGSAKIKTDKIDARMLSQLLAADLLPEAHISSPKVRQMRSYLRHRCALVGVRTQAKNRVHSILAGYGLKSPTKDLFCKKGREWLSEQKLGDLHQEQVDQYLELIDLLAQQILKIDLKIKPLAEQDQAARLVASAPGIGYFSALLIIAEIDGVKRFTSAKQLVSYAGLCPSTRSSGGKSYHGHITRTGSRFLRWIMVEAAQKAAYPKSPLNPFYWSIAKRKGTGTAKVAVARKLLESIYHMLKTDKAFDPSVWDQTTERRGVASSEA
jgi:transposase